MQSSLGIGRKRSGNVPAEEQLEGFEELALHDAEVRKSRNFEHESMAGTRARPDVSNRGEKK